MDNTYYDLLGLSRDALPEEIKQAAQTQLSAVRNAWHVLSDDDKRTAYDQELQLKTAQAKAHSTPAATNKPTGTADMTEVQNPYQAPDAAVDDDWEETDVSPMATRGKRLGAALLDTLTYMVPLLLAFIILYITGNADMNTLENLDGEDKEVFVNIAIAIVGVGYLLLIIINLRLLYLNGQSIGKYMLNIKIVRSNGNRCGLGRIIGLRIIPIILLSIIPVMGDFVNLIDVLFIFQASRQCLHDMIADTIVVQIS